MASDILNHEKDGYLVTVDYYSDFFEINLLGVETNLDYQQIAS